MVGVELFFIVFAILMFFLFLGIPVGVAIGMTCIATWFLIPTIPSNPGFIFRNMVIALDTTAFLAVPLFIYSGYIMAKGGISKRLFDFFAYFVGNKTAGMPIATIITTMFYSSFTGSAPATVAAIGSMTFPMLEDLGYNKKFVVAMVTVAGGLGIILPPSVPMIVYAVAVNASVGDLFLAGIIPGLIVGLVLIAFVYIYYKVKKSEDKEKLALKYNELRERGFLNIFASSILALLTPVIILGGIYGGIFTPSEAANISVVYAIVISMFIYRSMTIQDLVEVTKNAAETTCKVFIIVATAVVFGRVLTLMQAGPLISDLMGALFQSPVVILLVIHLFLIIFGLFLEPLAKVLIFAPIFFPIVAAIGIHPVHFGIMFVLNMAIGFVTPPIGMSLFMASSISKVPLLPLAKYTVPFLLLLLLVLLLVTFVPGISMFIIS